MSEIILLHFHTIYTVSKNVHIFTFSIIQSKMDQF